LSVGLFSGENPPEFLGIKEDLRSLGLAFLDLLVWKLILILFPFVVFMGKLKGSFSVLLCSAWWLLMRILSLVKVSWFFFNHRGHVAIGVSSRCVLC